MQETGSLTILHFLSISLEDNNLSKLSPYFKKSKHLVYPEEIHRHSWKNEISGKNLDSVAYEEIDTTAAQQTLAM